MLAGFVFLSPARAPARPTAAAPAPPPVEIDAGVAAFYRARGFRTFWAERDGLRPEAGQLLAMLGPSAPAELRRAVAAADSGDPHALTRADLLLSQAYADYARAQLAPPAASAMRYIDPGLAPAPPSQRAALEAAAASPSLADHLEAVARINPVYDGLSRGLAAYRARWSAAAAAPAPRPSSAGPAPPAARPRPRRRAGRGVARIPARPRPCPTGAADPATIAALNRGAAYYERLVQANIERARAIPARPDGRYILVDTASARLWMVDNGRISGAMRVVVGKRAMPTPLMAGLIRYAALNPYWNLPPDLIRKRAGKAARRAHGVITGERLQVLSDWTPQARVLAPTQVDWRAVAAGRRFVNLRQLPGPANMMGRIKFMMPNDLGVYLHDTPLRDLLRRADRHESSGCVRLEDAPRLARWLFEGRRRSPTARRSSASICPRRCRSISLISPPCPRGDGRRLPERRLRPRPRPPPRPRRARSRGRNRIRPAK